MHICCLMKLHMLQKCYHPAFTTSMNILQLLDIYTPVLPRSSFILFSLFYIYLFSTAATTATLLLPHCIRQARNLYIYILYIFPLYITHSLSISFSSFTLFAFFLGPHSLFPFCESTAVYISPIPIYHSIWPGSGSAFPTFTRISVPFAGSLSRLIEEDSWDAQ